MKESSPSSRTSSNGALVTFGLLLVMASLAVVAWARADGTRAFFSGDEGLKSVQRSALADGHEWLADPAIGFAPSGSAPAPATASTPGALEVPHRPSLLTPWRPPFVQPCGDGLCSVWRNPVVRAGGVLERWGGPPLAALLSWLGLAAWLWATALLARRIGAPPKRVALALLVASPAWMYGVLFWEHAPAAAAITLVLAWSLGARRGSSSPNGADGLAVPSPRQVLGAVALGMLTAAAALSRPEVALLAIAGFVMALRHRQKAEVAAWTVGGLLASAVAIGLGDGLSSWLGNNATLAAADGAPIARRLGQITRLLAGSRGVLGGGPAGPIVPGLGWPIAWLVAATAACVALPWLSPRIQRGGLWVVLVGAVAAVALSLVEPSAQLVGLLLVAPVAWIGLAAGMQRATNEPASAEPTHALGRTPDRRRFAALLLGTLIVALVAAPNDGGSQWGPRYLLPWLAPALALAFAAPQSWRWLVRAALVVGLVAQLGGVRHLQHQQANKSAALRWLTASPAKVLVAQAWYTPQELAALSLDADWTLALAADLPALQLAIGQLGARGTAWWIFAAEPRLDAARLLGRGGRWRVVGSRDVAFPPTRVRLHLVTAAQKP